MGNSFRLSERLKSFSYAFSGMRILLKSQHNARIHACATLLVFLTGFYFGYTKAEWCLITLAIISVWTAEAFNTALEYFADMVTEESHPLIANTKDVAAAAVLIAAIGSVFIGVIIIGPHIIDLIK